MVCGSWFKAVCAAAAAALAVVVHAQTLEQRLNEIVDNLDDATLIGQMTQLNIDEILDGNGLLDENKVRTYARLRVGSFLNSPYAGGPKGTKYGWNATEWRDVMTRIQRVSMAENGGHPVIFGIDSVHGANYVMNATIFGQQINAGASFNPDLVYKMGQITGRDTAAGGMPWIFGPILEVSQNPMWARTYETFGEDPFLVSVMGANMIRGIQNNAGVAACMKHFIGYSKLATGKDRDAVTMSDFDLLNYFAPPFRAAVEAGVKTAMENYISINGVPTVASAKLMKDLLRYDMGFEGFVVTDWEEINNLFSFHRVAKSEQDAVRMSLTRTSIDMSMVPTNTRFIDHAKALLASNPQIRARLKESARRIIKTKLELNLYNVPVPGEQEVNKVGQEADREVARQLARESIVLLENKDNVLPLAETASVFLTGHSADNIGYLCGGWTLAWQGSRGNTQFPMGVSVRMGMEAIGKTAVTFKNAHDETAAIKDDILLYNDQTMAEALRLAANAQYIVAVIGEKTYTEKIGDINDLALPSDQYAFVEKLLATGKKVILVLVGGRPLLLGDLPSKVHAIINAMLPGEHGGTAIAEIIYGKVNPSGRLPLSYHKHAGNILIPYNRPVSTRCRSGAECEFQWVFGAGRSYTTFNYESVTLDKTTVNSNQKLEVTVSVRNTGSRAGKETVMLFLTQPFREIAVPEVKMLKKFQKVEVQPGNSVTVKFTLSSDDWSVFDPQIGNKFQRVTENGDFVVSIGPETNCKVYDADLGDLKCKRFRLEDSVNTVALTASASVADAAGTVFAFNG